MTLEDLRVFVAVGETGSLSAVARCLGCTQPAVSQHITRLERELDVELLKRSRQGVEPTAAGRALLDTAVESLTALKDGLARLDELKGHAAQSLTIATGATSVRHFLRDTVVRFRRNHPHISLQFVPANTTQRCLQLVKTGAADLALVTVRDSEPGVEQRTLAQQDLRLLVPQGDKLGTRKRMRLRDMEDMHYIGLSSETTSANSIDLAFRAKGIRVSRSMTVDDFDTACLFVELGLGYAIVPAVQAASFCKSAEVAAVPIVGLAPLSLGLAARRWQSLGAIAHEFVELFSDELRHLAHSPGVTLAPDA